MHKLLCIGQEWRGSNASGLFHAFSRVGCAVSILDDHRHISLSTRGTALKLAERFLRPLQVREYNARLLSMARAFKPDLVFVYKGPFVDPETLHQLKRMALPVVNFFPDVSFTTHGSRIVRSMPHYDFVFTTKSFGASDLQKNFGVPGSRVHFIPHGFDPFIHRRLVDPNPIFACEASFIGTYSPHKERYLAYLKSVMPGLGLLIWGNWEKSKVAELKKSICGMGVHGDLYALAINQSTVNIALLSEQVAGASRGDQITSRTFHIPGAGGFMLHQRTDELLQYFDEGKEIACFESPGELLEKTAYYLKNDSERKKLQENGFVRAQRDHTLDARAREILTILKSKSIL